MLKDVIFMAFGERMAEARKGKELTQKKLAALLGVSPMRISHYESNNREPDIESIKKISAVLEVSPNWLLGLATIKKPVTSKDDGLNENPKIKELHELIKTMSPPELDRFYQTAFLLFGEREK